MARAGRCSVVGALHANNFCACLRFKLQDPGVNAACVIPAHVRENPSVLGNLADDALIFADADPGDAAAL